jgi:2,3-bisphosphoglycerate-dependent phosphoglycerate mutase
MDSTQPIAADGGMIKEYRFKVPEGATELLILRHGESAGADPAVPFALLAGHGDPELSTAGRWQAERLADRLAGEHISAIYVSSLRRTAQTAAPLADRLGITPVTEHDLREAHFGEWEGNVWRVRIVERHPVAMRMISEQRWDIVPGAEPAAAFAARVRGALNRIVSRHPGQTVAVFTHGGVIGQALGDACGCEPFPFNAADNASVSQLVHVAGRWKIRRFNDTTHLHSGFSVVSEPLTLT